ncbi:MAG: hypothetical protein MJ188_03175 [Treponema sp.]|nr:hypothetical protein [Treponema sp.]
MKNKTKYLIMEVILFLLFMTGCNNLFRTDNYQSSDTTRSSVYISIFYPNNSNSAIQGRAALPELPDASDISYKVTATKVESTSSEKITREITSDNNVITLNIGEGIWKIEAFGFYLKQELDTEPFDDKNLIYYGCQELIISSSGKYNITIPVFYIAKDSGKIDLKIELTDSCIDYVQIGGSGTNLDGKYYKNQDNIITIKNDNIPAGTYNCVFTFFQENNLSHPENHNLNSSQLLSIVEKINIRKNLTTNSWMKSGNTIYFSTDEVTNENRFVLSKSIITNIVNNSVYVSYKNQDSLLPDITINDNSIKNGTWANPFNSLQEAFNKVIALNNNNGENNNTTYLIYIDGKVSANDIHFFSQNKIQIELLPYTDSSGNTTALLEYNFSEENLPTDENILLSINKNVHLIIRDLQITGGNIYLENNQNCVLYGEPKLTNGNFILDDTSILRLNHIQISSDIIGIIQHKNPEKNRLVLQGIDQFEPSTAIINRFLLHNEGYYLDFNHENKTGIITPSTIRLKLPQKEQFLVNASIHNQKGDELQFNSDNMLIIPSKDLQTPDSQLTFTFSITNPLNNDSKIKAEDINLTFFVDSSELSIPDRIIQNQENINDDFQKEITLPCTYIYPGNYMLIVRYYSNGLNYDEKYFLNFL